MLSLACACCSFRLGPHRDLSRSAERGVLVRLGVHNDCLGERRRPHPPVGLRLRGMSGVARGQRGAARRRDFCRSQAGTVTIQMCPLVSKRYSCSVVVVFKRVIVAVFPFVFSKRYSCSVSVGLKQVLGQKRHSAVFTLPGMCVCVCVFALFSNRYCCSVSFGLKTGTVAALLSFS